MCKQGYKDALHFLKRNGRYSCKSVLHLCVFNDLEILVGVYLKPEFHGVFFYFLCVFRSGEGSTLSRF